MIREQVYRHMLAEVRQKQKGGRFGQNAAAREWGVDVRTAHTLFLWLESGEPESKMFGLDTMEKFCKRYHIKAVSDSARLPKPKPCVLRRKK